MLIRMITLLESCRLVDDCSDIHEDCSFNLANLFIFSLIEAFDVSQKKTHPSLIWTDFIENFHLSHITT